jgi:hypothetical protein
MGKILEKTVEADTVVCSSPASGSNWMSVLNPTDGLLVCLGHQEYSPDSKVECIGKESQKEHSPSSWLSLSKPPKANPIQLSPQIHCGKRLAPYDLGWHSLTAKTTSLFVTCK